MQTKNVQPIEQSESGGIFKPGDVLKRKVDHEKAYRYHPVGSAYNLPELVTVEKSGKGYMIVRECIAPINPECFELFKFEEKHNPGYHIRNITKGEFGEISKIREELEEMEDAWEQNNRIMTAIEASDLYGALRAFLKQHFPSFKMSDLETMADATERAFQNGHRSPSTGSTSSKP